MAKHYDDTLTLAQLQERLTLTPTETAKVLHIHINSVYDALNDGTITGRKVNGRWLVNAPALLAAIDQHAAQAVE